MSKIFALSGVGSHIMDLSEELIAKGNHVWIMSSTNDHEDFCRETGIEFTFCDFSVQPLRMIKNIKFIQKFFKENNIDIVHCHHRTCSMYMQILSKLTGVPFVWTNHLDNIPSDFIHRKLTFYGKQAICVSSELKSFCTDKLRIPEEKISIVYNGINPKKYSFNKEYADTFKSKHNIGKQKVIGLFARMSPVKGHRNLIHAVSMLPEAMRDQFFVVFFGEESESDYTKELRQLIKENNLENNFIFEGFVKPDEALSICDLTVLPSSNEGMGIVTMESFLTKKLHMRTKTAGYAYFKDFCIGFDIGDDQALSEYIKDYLDGNESKELVEAAYDFAINNCTSSIMAEKVLAIYKNALKQS